MSDTEFQETAHRIDKNLEALGQFLNDCEALGEIAARYPRGTKLGEAVARCYAVFMAKATGVGKSLDAARTVDPTDATEFVG